MASSVNLLPRVIHTESVSLEDAEKLRGIFKNPRCAAEGCRAPLIRSELFRNASLTEKGPISRIFGTRSYFHDRCLPGCDWIELQPQVRAPQQSQTSILEPQNVHKVSFLRQVVNGTANTIYRHRLITALAITALVAGLAYTFATAETLQTFCYQDTANSTMAWCADVSKQDDLATSVFVKYQGIRDWVPSGDLSTRTFESVKNGSQFVYHTFTKYFSRALFG